MFFVISGFIMVYSSAELFGARGAAATFLKRRWLRIVPLYWIFTTAWLVAALALPGALNGAELAPGHVAASYLFLPLPAPDGSLQPLYGLGWTLNFEMFFYVLFSAALFLPRGYAVAAVTAALVSLVLLGAIADLPPPFAFWTQPIILEFAAGMALGLLHAAGLRIPGAASLALALLGLNLLLVLPGEDLPRWVALGLPALAIVAGAGMMQESGGTRRLERGLVALGDASYALYLVHPFVIRPLTMAALFVGISSLAGIALYAAVALGIAVIAALVVHDVIERPFMGRRSKLRGMIPSERRGVAT